MHFFPVYLKGIVELQAVERYGVFIVSFIKEIIGEFPSEVLDILSCLHPPLIFCLLEVLAEYVWPHSLREWLVTRW